MKKIVEEKHSRKVIKARMANEDGDMQTEQAEAILAKQKVCLHQDIWQSEKQKIILVF